MTDSARPARVSGAPAPQAASFAAGVARRRTSKRLLRTWAWLSGALAFLVPWVAFRVQPKPAVALVPMSATSSSRKVIVVHRILRRIVIDAPEEAAGPRYVYAAPTSGTSTVAPSGSSSAPAATSTGGSVP